MSEALLGIDVGTTATKAVLVAPDGQLLAAAARPYVDGRDSPHPPDWWDGVVEAVREVGRGAAGAEIGAIGVCGRGGGLALLDHGGEAIALPWAEVLAEARQITGPPRPRYPRLARWGALVAAARRVDATVAARLHAVLTVKDYVNLRLTGRRGTDPFSAACRRWPADRSAYGFLPAALLAPIRAPDARLGGLEREAAAALGLPAGTPVAVGGHDGVCANIGAGMLEEGEGCLTLGTLGVVRVNTAGPVRPSPRLATFTYPFLGGLWTSGGDVASGGSALVWLARTLGLYDGSPAGFAEAHARLDRLAAAAPAGSEGVVFLPYLHGMLSPAQRPGAAGAYAGLRAEHGAAHLARATMEGVALALRDILERLEARRAPAKTLRLTGGGTRSPVWPGIVASVVERPLGLVEPEASARGAAILAAVASGRQPDIPHAAQRMVREVGRVEPGAAAGGTYGRALERFRALADATYRIGRR